jgi:ankyrin repeat protein
MIQNKNIYKFNVVIDNLLETLVDDSLNSELIPSIREALEIIEYEYKKCVNESNFYRLQELLNKVTPYQSENQLTQIIERIKEKVGSDTDKFFQTVNKSISISENTQSNSSKTTKENLLYYIYDNQLKIVTSIIKKNKSILNLETPGHNTPLIFAAQYGRLEIIELLIRYGANINLRDCNDLNAVAWAIIKGHEDCLRFFLKCKETNINDQFLSLGKTLLMIAIQEKQKKCIDLLLEQEDLDLGKKDANGLNALDYALIAAKSSKLVIKLIDHGVKEPINQLFCNLIHEDIPIHKKKKILLAINRKWGINLSTNIEGILLKQKNLLIWGLEGSLKCGDQAITLGITPKESLKFFKKLIQDFTEQPRFYSNNAILPNLNLLNENLFIPDVSIVDKIIKKINKGQPVLLLTGWHGHATSLLFYKKYVLKCDRSGYSKNCVESYVRKNPVSKEVLFKLSSLQEDENQIDSARHYFMVGMNDDLDLEKDDDLQITVKKQNTNNCGVSPLKAAVYELLRILAHENPNKYDKNDQELALEIYKSFTAFSAFKLLSEYLNQKPNAEIDYYLLRAIKERIFLKLLNPHTRNMEKHYLMQSLSLIKKLEKNEGWNLDIRNVFIIVYNEIREKIKNNQIISLEWYHTLKWLSTNIQSTGNINDLIKLNNFTHELTPLMFAAMNNYIEIAALFIKNGADINLYNNTGQFPLLFAAKKGHINMVKMLIANQANVNAKNSSGITSIQYAVEGGWLECVKELNNTGKIDLFKTKALIGRAIRSNEPKMLEYLIFEQGLNASIYINDNNILDFAIKHNKLKSAEYIKEYGLHKYE